MARRAIQIALAFAAVLVLPPVAGAGVAARFLPTSAVAGRPLEVRLELDDPLGTIGRIEVELEVRGVLAVTTATASGDRRLWTAWFPAEVLPGPGDSAALRAVLLGARGGLILDLGADEPLVVEVLTPARAAAQDRVLRTPEPEADLDLTAQVGVDGRLGSTARARALVAVGAQIARRQELIAAVSVGPAFARPAALAGGGPLVLGVELAWRAYTVAPELSRWAPFLEAGAAADLRFPGFDPALQLRAGISLALGGDTRAEASLGGALAWLEAAGPGDPSLGAWGGLRVTLRFGSSRDIEATAPQ